MAKQMLTSGQYLEKCNQSFICDNVICIFRATRIIPLRCMAPIDFEFQIQMLQPHPAFTVDPLIGYYLKLFKS